MPVKEFAEYVKFLNEEIEQKKQAYASSANSFTGNNDVKMAGNTVPRF